MDLKNVSRIVQKLFLDHFRDLKMVFGVIYSSKLNFGDTAAFKVIIDMALVATLRAYRQNMPKILIFDVEKCI